MTGCLIIVLLLLRINVHARVRFTTLNRDIVQSRLQSYKGNDRQREMTLKQMFESAGCSGERLVEQTVKGLKEPNLICTLTGHGDTVILVGAHYDHAELGEGVADNWTGASLLPSLYQAMSSQQPRFSFVFVAFAGEEKGLVGSRYYVNQLTKESIAKIQAMICMDTLGLSTTEIWLAKSDTKLTSALHRLGLALKLPRSAVNVDQVGDSDEEPFSQRRIPVLVVHSLTQETLGILHSPGDNYKVINFDHYYDSYRLLSAYLEVLDQTPVLTGTAAN